MKIKITIREEIFNDAVYFGVRVPEYTISSIELTFETFSPSLLYTNTFPFVGLSPA